MVAEAADVKLADRGALQRPAGIDVGEGRAARHLEERRDRPVAVEADRHLPAVRADQFSNRAARVEAVERQEVHLPTVPRGDRTDGILLLLALVFGAEP